MTYDCHSRERIGPQWKPWKESGHCQHDSHADERCKGCTHQRKQSTQVPQDGTGGVK